VRIYRFFVYTVLILVLGCETKRAYTSKPTKSIVNPDSDLLELSVAVYNMNDSISTIFLKIVNENLIYRRTDTSSSFYSEIKVSYRLLTEIGSRKIIDSSSYKLWDRAGEEQVSIHSILSSFQVKSKGEHHYFMELDVFDINKKTKYSKGVNIYRNDKSGEQNFLVSKNNEIVFGNTFNQAEEVNIRFNNTSVSQVTVDCFIKDFPPASPPFSTRQTDENKYKPDSSFIAFLNNGTLTMRTPSKGFFHLRPFPFSMEGLTLLTFDESFPGVGNIDEMIDCTRYLMNKSEYDACKSATDKKDAIDHFWIDIGGSNERAKELLKRYYGRVKEANKYYTSYTQGWKTDRGMVFVVFGSPSHVYRSTKGEIWIYGVESNPHSLRYTFNKTKNPFSDNDFVLERSQFLKDAWYNAVDYWRQGHVYIEHRR
jgi:GWxTD domain-containing protein